MTWNIICKHGDVGDFFNVKTRSPTSQSFHPQKPSPTSVTNINVAYKDYRQPPKFNAIRTLTKSYFKFSELLLTRFEMTYK